jgi:hypothetical protein
VDRHEAIGKGKIGRAAFGLLMTHPRLAGIPIVLETPKEGADGKPCSAASRPGDPPPIGVGRPDWVRAPLPPNRAGGSPAHGSPVDGFTSVRIERPWHGRLPD